MAPNTIKTHVSGSSIFIYSSYLIRSLGKISDSFSGLLTIRSVSVGFRDYFLAAKAAKALDFRQAFPLEPQPI